jgi:hypothetical protein
MEQAVSYALDAAIPDIVLDAPLSLHAWELGRERIEHRLPSVGNQQRPDPARDL